MLKERDNIHLSLRPLFGYNKPFNFVISPREPGKSTCLWCDLFYTPFINKGLCLLMLVDTANSVDEAMITSIEDKIHEFCDESFKFTYKRSDVGKESIFDLYAERNGKQTRAIRFISFNCPMQRIKQTAITNISYMAQDEFIKNPKYGEKYVVGQYKKLRDIYSTYVRGTPRLQFWAFGNPISLYNPYFVGFNVSTKDIAKLMNSKVRASKAYEMCAVHWAPLTDELREFIVKRNPFYQFDEEYKNFAIEGININDNNIALGELKSNYMLYCIFKIEGKYIGVYQDTTFMQDYAFYASFISDIGKRRTAYCFDLDEIVERTVLLSHTERQRFSRLRDAIRSMNIYFSSIEVYYLIKEIYYLL